MCMCVCVCVYMSVCVWKRERAMSGLVMLGYLMYERIREGDMYIYNESTHHDGHFDY